MLQAELKTQLKTEKIGGVYLFCGEEDYLKRYYIGEIRKRILTDPAFDAFNHLVFHGETVDFAALTDGISAPPMMADRKLIEWTGLNADGMKDDDFDRMEELVRQVDADPSTVVVFVAGTEGMNAGTVKRPTAVFKRLSAILQAINFEPSPDEKLIAWLSAHFAHEGLEAGRDALRLMVDRCGHNMDILASETDKLVCYAHAQGERMVSASTVEFVTASTAEDDAFGLTNAVLAGDTPGAYRKLSDLFRRRVDPMMILGQISRLISDLASVSILLSEGTSVPAIASTLSMNEYKAGLYVKSAGRRKPAEFRAALERCREVDLAVKRGADAVVSLDRLISELSAR